VVTDCTEALKHNPKNAKGLIDIATTNHYHLTSSTALLRRGMAYEALEKWNLGIEGLVPLSDLCDV